MNDYKFELDERAAPSNRPSDNTRQPSSHRHHREERPAQPRLSSLLSRYGLLNRQASDTQRKHDRGQEKGKERDDRVGRAERGRKTTKTDRADRADRDDRTLGRGASYRDGKTASRTSALTKTTSTTPTTPKTVSSSTSTWPAWLPAYAVDEGRRLTDDMQHGRRQLHPRYIVTMRDTRNDCGGGQHRNEKLPYQGRAADLLDECAKYLAYVRTQKRAGLAKTGPPRSLFSRIEEWYSIPETQQWQLWGVHQVHKETEDEDEGYKDKGKDKVEKRGLRPSASLLDSRSDLLRLLTEFCAGAGTRRRQDDLWILYLVVDVAPKQPRLVDTNEVKAEETKETKQKSQKQGEGSAHPQPQKPSAGATPDRRQRDGSAREGATSKVGSKERAAPEQRSRAPEQRSRVRASQEDETKRKVRLDPNADEEPLIPQDNLNDDSARRPGNGALLRQVDVSGGGGGGGCEDANDIDWLLPLSATPTDSQWAKCCRLLLLDPKEHQDAAARTIRIPGSALLATPQQYWTAFCMLTWRARHRQEDDGSLGGLGGGLLADAPGSGKTHTVLVFCLLRALLFHNRASVRGSWAADDGRHRRNRSSSKNDKPCPCNNVHGIECFAAPRSIARRIFEADGSSGGDGDDGGDSLARGPALIQAGPTVIEDWKAALCAARLSTTYYHAVLFHTSAATTARELARPDGLAAKMGCAATAPKKRKTEGGDRTQKKQEKQEKQEMPVEDCTFSFGLDDRPGHRPLERYIFLTTYEAGRFKADFQIPVSFAEGGTRLKRMAGRSVSGPTVYGCPVGLHIVDEFHRVRDMQSSAVQLALAHKHMHASNGNGNSNGNSNDNSNGNSDRSDWSNKFAFWGVSGTPLPGGRLTDLAGLVAVLQQPAWDHREHIHHIRRAEALTTLEDLRKRAAASSSTPAEHDSFRRRTLEFFGSDLVIRHAGGGTPLVRPTRVSFATPIIHRYSVQVLADGARHRLARIDSTATVQAAAVSLEGYRALGLMQVLSCFPGLARLVAGQEDGRHRDMVPSLLRACADPVEAANLLLPAAGSTAAADVAAVPLVAACWQPATQDSPKLNFVVRLLQAMDRDREGGRTKKLLLITPGLVDAVLFYAALRQRRPDWHPALLHSHLTAAAKADVLAGLKKTGSGSCRLLIAPFAIGGTGLNLQAASYQVLTAPLRRRADEEQCFRRTNRTGQQLPLHHYVLLSEDSPYDRLLVAAQAGKTLVGDAFDVGADVAVV